MSAQKDDAEYQQPHQMRTCGAETQEQLQEEQKNKKNKGGIRWDEMNLEENERIKKELNPRRIDEPKTPYMSPYETTTDEERDDQPGYGIDDLSIEDKMPASIKTKRQAWSDSDSQPSNGNVDSSAGSSPFKYQDGSGVRIMPSNPSEGKSPRFSCDYYAGDSEEEDIDDETAEKKRKFKEARKAHYNMKEAWLVARATEDEDMYEEEEIVDGQEN